MSNKKTILIVEDEKPMCKILKDLFSNNGFIVEIAENGELGLQKALSIHPDLILLDIIMPKMDGLTMYKKLKEDSWGKEAKTIILSNLSSGEEFEKAREAGVNDYLVKSDWSLDEILDKVRKKLSSTANS